MLPVIAAWALAQEDATPHSHVELRMDRGYQAGANVRAYLTIYLDPGWHTYWKNPGETGAPTTVRWALPEGWILEDERWAIPQRIVENGIVSYGYKTRCEVRAEISVPPGATGTHTVGADVEYLVCEETCLPASDSVRAVTSDAVPAISTHFGDRTPFPRDLGTKATWREAGGMIEVRLLYEKPAALVEAVPLAEKPGLVHPGALPTVVRADGGEFVFTLPRSPYPVEQLDEVPFLLVWTQSPDAGLRFTARKAAGHH